MSRKTETVWHDGRRLWRARDGRVETRDRPGDPWRVISPERLAGAAELSAEDSRREKWRNDQLRDGAQLLPAPIVALIGRFCGCGSQPTAWAWVAGYLAHLRLGGRFDPEADGAGWIAIYLMDSLGLTEHGCNIAYARLTQDGVLALAFLERWGPEWAEAGWFIDDDGITWGRVD